MIRSIRKKKKFIHLVVWVLVGAISTMMVRVTIAAGPIAVTFKNTTGLWNTTSDWSGISTGFPNNGANTYAVTVGQGTAKLSTAITVTSLIVSGAGKITTNSANTAETLTADTITFTGNASGTGGIQGSAIVNSAAGAGNGLIFNFGGNGATISNNAVLGNYGAAGVWNSEGSILGTNNSKILNASTGTLTITAGGLLLLNNGATSTFVNNGTLNIDVSGDTNLPEFETEFFFTNTGTLEVKSGTFGLSGGATLGGTLIVDAGAALNLDFGTFDFTPGSATVTGSGVVNITNGTVTATNGNSFTANVINIEGGDPGFDPNNTGSIISGSVVVQSTTGANNGLSFKFAESGYSVTVQDTAELINYGSAGGWSGADGVSVFGYGSAQLINAAGATFTVTAAGELSNQASAVFTNNGSLVIDPGLGKTFISGWAFVNAGTTEVKSGTYSLIGGGTLGGSFTVDSGAVLSVDGGTFNIPTGGTTITGAVNITGPFINATAANTLTADVVNITGETGAIFEGSVLVNSGSGAGKGLIFQFADSNADYASLENNAVLTNNGIAGGFGGAAGGIIYGYDNAQLVNAMGATFTVSTTGFLAVQDGTPSFTNNGSFVVNPGATGFFLSGWTFNNTGSISVQSGIFSLAGGGILGGTATVTSGAFMSLDNGTFTIPAAGATVTGELDINGATLDSTTSGKITADFIVVSGLGGANFIDSVQVNTGTGAGNGLSFQFTDANGDWAHLENNAIVTNNGSAGGWSGVAGANVYGYDNAQLVNALGATFTVSTGGNLSLQSGSPTFVNNGSLVVDPGSGNIFTSGWLFNNSGSTSVQSGTFSLLSGGTLGGTFAVSSGAVLSLDGGSFAIPQGGASVTGTMTLTNAIVTATAANTLTADTLLVTGNGGASFTGSVQVNSSTGANNGLVFDFPNSNSWVELHDNAVVTNYGGNGQWTGFNGELIFGYDNAQFVNALGATFTISTGGQFAENGSATFTNNGTLNIDPGATNTFTTGFPFYNTGATTVKSGEFVILSGGGSSSGDITVNSGAALTFSGVNFDLKPATYNFNGTVNFNNSTITFDSSATGTGTANLTAANLTSTAIETLTQNVINIQLGTVSGDLQINSGTGAGNGLIFDFIDSSSGSTLEDNVVLTNYGAAGGYSAAVDGVKLQGNGNAQLINANGATFSVTTAALFQQNGSASFTNNGTLNINPGAGKTFTNQWTFINSGATNVQSGTYSLLGGGTLGGSFDVSSGATFSVDSGSYIIPQAGATVSGAINITNGTFNSSAPATSGILTADVINIFGSSGQVAVYGSAQIKSGSAANDGLIFGQTNTIPSTFPTTFLHANAVLSNNGGAGLWNSPDVLLYGYDNSQLINAAGATFDVISPGQLAQWGSATFTNSGNLIIEPGAGKTFASGWYFSNTGTVTVNSGTFGFVTVASGPGAVLTGVAQISGNTLTAGTWIVNNGGTLAFPDGTSITTNQASVSLRGSTSAFAAINSLASNQGSFSILAGRSFSTAGDLQNSGKLTLGGPLTVNGNLSLQSDSDFVFELAGLTPGSGYGDAAVSGTTGLTGLLDVDVDPSLVGTLTSNETFTLVDSTGTLSGAFSNVTNGQRITSEDGDYSFAVNYGPGSSFGANNVVLSDPVQLAVPEPTAWNLLLFVAGAIFLTTRRREKVLSRN